MLQNFRIGIGSYGKAIEFIFKHKLSLYFLVPLLLNLLLFSIGFHFIGDLTDAAIEYSKEQFEVENWNFLGADFLKSIVIFLIWLILRILFFFFFIFVGGQLILILMSPVLAYLSEKTEYIIRKKEYPFELSQFLKDILRGIGLSLKNFLKEIAAIVILFFVSFIPIIGLVTPLLLFLISSYYFGFSFIDYALERRKLSASSSSDYMKQHKGLAIGNGILFAAALAIPVFGVGIAAFAAIISTVAATISLLEKEKEITIST
jgi:CysZ protein